MALTKRLTPAFIACSVYLILRAATHYSASLFEVSQGIAIWYPPCGLALALLTLLGLRYFPVVLLGNVVTAAIFPEFHHSWMPALLAIVGTANSAAAAWFARRFLDGVLLPGETRSTAIFSLIVILSPAAMALAGNATLVVAGIKPSSEFWESALKWWVGDVSGLLTVVPPIMVFAGPWLRGESFPSFKIKRRWPASTIILQSLLLIGFLLLVFAWKSFGEFTPFYLCFLPLIWICFCHGLVGATLAVLAITMGGLIGLHFSGGSTPLLVVHFLFFELAIACVGLGLGSAVTRRNKMQRELVTSQAETERLLQVIEATTDYIITTGEDLSIRYANTSFIRVAGKGPLASLRNHVLTEFLPAATGKAIEREAIPTALSAGAWHGELTIYDGVRAEVPVSIVVQAHPGTGGNSVTLSFVLRNIARQKQAEADRLESERRLQQVQKLESLGVLAGGIAHDFNNLLTPLLGYASLARLDLPAEHPIQQILNKIEKSTERAASLCQQMLAYAGKNPLAFSEIDLSKLIDDTSHLLRVSTGKKRTLNLELARPLHRITADPIQMRQIFMNLVLNASEAIGDNTGTITMRTREETLDRTTLTHRFHGRSPDPGLHVVLEVEDDGCGMTPEVYARIFEPFFSTKFAGHGLGLAAVLGIVKSHRGSIQVKSTQDKGTLFRIYFPAIVKAATETVAPFASAGPWRGSGRVLIVDDEPDVRTVVARALEVSGFTSAEAADGLDGLEYFKKHSKDLRLVILDLTMPRMDGEQAFHEMHKFDANVPIILMSGYSQKLTLERFVDAKPAAFLSKPFDYRSLQNCLRQLPAFRNG